MTAGGAVLGERGATVRLPGFANAHSHAFHRALRGLSETRSGDFWTWRQLMYEVAGRLDPTSYRELATLVYAEMLLAGWTSVGEFHYLHHAPGGTRYSDPNEMSWALVEAARSAGIRLTLLDACYLQADVGGEELEGVQLRFSDGDGDSWSRRVMDAAETQPYWQEAEGAPPARLGMAIHSVRAVPRQAMRSVAALAAHRDAPLHFHVSEQRRENESCLAATQLTPTDLLKSVGALTRHSTAVHATHLSPSDVTAYGLAGAGVCACPTTERDLGDGVGPFAELADSGAVLSIGSDSHAVIDPFEEARSLELHQRLVEERRGVMGALALLEAATAGGARALGWPLAPEQDSVTVRLDRSPSLAGVAGTPGPDGTFGEEALVAGVLFAASPADVETVRVAGETVVEDGEHVRLGPRERVAERLAAAVRAVLDA